MSTLSALGLASLNHARPIDLTTRGSSGLRSYSGYVEEGVLRELQGKRGIANYRAMLETDATCAAIINCFDKMLRQVSWTVAPASTADFDREAADFVESCMHDMEISWMDFLGEAFSFLPYGHSLHEVLYKRRAGDADDPLLNSHYGDGRIGWRGFAGRSQDTLSRWLFDDHGRLLGAEQQAPPHYRVVTLPIDKCLLFRTSAVKNNPEGVSIFRGAYRSWRIKQGLENIEATGCEKDVSGLPIVWIPRELLALAQQKATYEDGTTNLEVAAAKAMVAEFQKMATEVRRDAHEGLVMPLEHDEQGNKRFDITLLASGGSRQFDLDKIIQRWDLRVAVSVLAEFLFMGQGTMGAGSFAMHQDKRGMFMQSLDCYLRTFTDTFNKGAVRKLMRLNTLKMSDYPRLEYGGLEKVDMTELGDLLLKASQAGLSVADPEMEDYVRRVAGWPERTEDLVDTSNVLPQPSTQTDRAEEIRDGDPVDPLREGELVQVPALGPVTNVQPRNEHPLLNATTPRFM